MKSLVEIAFAAIESFNLSDSEKEKLIELLQGGEKQVAQRQARKKLKKISQKNIWEKECERWLIKNHFKSQKGGIVN